MDIWDAGDFTLYARYCEQAGYCPPWHPYVGPEYGKSGLPTFMYCGGAAWWNETHQPASVHESAQATQRFIADGMYGSPFWHMFDRLAAIVFPDVIGRREFVRRSVWTNLTKTGLVQQTAPPDSDAELRRLDVAQMRKEFAILVPDIIVCVSGSIVPSTGYSLFDADWLKVENAEIATPSTWMRLTPWGGVLLWTMHPAYKSESWKQSVEADLRTLMAVKERTE